MQAEEEERQRKFVEDTMDMMRRFEQQHPSLEFSGKFSDKRIFTIDRNNEQQRQTYSPPRAYDQPAPQQVQSAAQP